MNEHEQDAAITDLQARVGALEARGAPTSPPPSGTPDPFGNDFYWDQTGVWLDVSIPPGQKVVRNILPPASWSGTLECSLGKLAGNLTDRVKNTFKGAGGVVLYKDDGWYNVSGYNVRFPASGPAVTWEIETEKDAHISLNCLHQP